MNESTGKLNKTPITHFQHHPSNECDERAKTQKMNEAKRIKKRWSKVNITEINAHAVQTDGGSVLFEPQQKVIIFSSSNKI